MEEQQTIQSTVDSNDNTQSVIEKIESMLSDSNINTNPDADPELPSCRIVTLTNQKLFNITEMSKKELFERCRKKLNYSKHKFSKTILKINSKRYSTFLKQTKNKMSYPRAEAICKKLNINPIALVSVGCLSMDDYVIFQYAKYYHKKNPLQLGKYKLKNK
jgi:hypothetical protein